MNHLQNGVTAFHKAFGHPAPAFPVTKISDELAEKLIARANWLHEEADELEEAVNERDMVKVVDALGDSIYFGVGGYVVLGLDMEPFWANIQNANMAKLGPDGQPIISEIDGKIQKPDGWVPPEALHAAELERIHSQVRIESAARQLAYLRATEPDAPIVLPPSQFTPEELIIVVDRAMRIAGREDAITLYEEMVGEIGEQ